MTDRADTCKICGNAERNKRYAPREMMFGTGESFDYFQCDKCGCLQITEFPVDISKYYPSNYYSYTGNASEGNSLIKLVKKIRNNYAVSGSGALGRMIYSVFPEPCLKSIGEVRPSKTAGILDVGSGGGVMLHALGELGFMNLCGVDPYLPESLIKNGERLKILKKNLRGVEDQWDIIIFNHSFEHLSDPLETLRKISTLLNTGGVCIIRIPTVTSYAWEHYGINWVQLDAPRHFFLHSRQSMRLAAGQAGLVVKKIIYDSDAFGFWGSEQYLKSIPLTSERSYAKNPSKSIFTRKQISSFRKKAEGLNAAQRGDQAAFYLRKQ